MKRIFSMLCVLALMLGMIAVPAYASEAKSVLQGENLVLTANAENLTVEADSCVDLNGYSIAGVTVADGATLYVCDSQTDDYTVADGIYGSVTGISGNVQAAEGYVAITGEGAVSYHKADLTLTSMSLRPTEAGVYYNSAFAADEVVAAKVETYGVALSVVAEPTAENLNSLCGYSTFRGFEAGEKAGTLLTGVMNKNNIDYTNNRNANMAIYGSAYIEIDGQYTFGACAKRSLKEQIQLIDAVFGTLNATQKAAIVEMFKTYKSVMSGWALANIQEASTGVLAGDVEIKIPVSVEDGKVTEEITVEQDGVTITIPMGALVETDELTLTVTLESETDVTASEGQSLLPLDVHVEGLSEANTAPLTIDLGKVLPENLNLGNYTAYHSEENGANEMTLVAADEEFTAHNQFKYTLDGEVTLHVASFSLFTLRTVDSNIWNGERDYSWYTNAIAKRSGEKIYEIRNADQLAGFGAIVGGMAEGIEQDSFSGKTVKLLADINIGDLDSENGYVFYPIGYNCDDGSYEKTGVAVTTGFYSFAGTFDGNGNTVSNFYQNTWEMKGDDEFYAASEQRFRDGMGLFGKIYGGTVKNLTVRNFQNDGEYTTTGVIAAYADGATFENIAIFNCNPRVYNIGNGGIVGCVGWYAKEPGLKTTFKNITVDNSNKISALWGTYDAACGGILGQYYPTSGQTGAGKPANGGVHFENCHVAAQMDVNNDVCGNYQYYAYRYTGMLIGSVRENVTIDGHVYPKMDGITAKDCTVHFGTWNDYYYCEFEKNGHPSYSGPDDYKFSRVDKSEIIFDENGVAIGCTHEHTDAEDNRAVYLPFNNLVTGYGWGVTTKVIGDLEGVTILDREVADSVEKFNGMANGAEYVSGNTVTIGDLFAAADQNNVAIVPGNVQVTVSPADDESTAGGTYVANTTDWTKGTLTFSGMGNATVTITDYYFCTPTIVNIKIDPVAKIGEVGYATLQDALDAVEDGGTVTLLDDVIVSKYLDVYTANNGETERSITLDLDGHTIAPGANYKYQWYPLIFVGINQTLTIMDGTVQADEHTAIGVYGTLNLESVNVIKSTANTEQAVCIWNWGEDDKYYEDCKYKLIGTADIKGGSIQGGILVEGPVSLNETASFDKLYLNTKTGHGKYKLPNGYGLVKENNYYTNLHKHTLDNGKCTVTGCGYAFSTSYVKTGLADVQSTDVVVVTMTKGSVTYALSSANGTTDDPVAVIVTVDGKTITDNVANTILWNINKDGDNLIFYPNGATGTWLYCTNANDGVRVGVNTSNTFVIDADTGYLKHNATNRYVGVYTDNPDWRCYTSINSNITGQTLAFYVLKTDCQHANTEERGAIEATCTIAGHAAGEYCLDCNTYISGGEMTDATGHDLVESKPSVTVGDCKVKHTYSCTVCNKVSVKTVTEHTEETVAGKAATCTETGLTEGKRCSACEEVLVAQTVIPATGKHAYVDGTCENCGAKELTEPSEPEENEPVAVTISFANTDQRTSFSTSAQVWENEGVTLTNNKASSTTNVADYSDPVRFYKSSSLTITAPGKITKIVIDCTDIDSDYTKGWGTVNNGICTVTLAGTSDTYTIDSLSAQVRANSITVTYTTTTGGETPEPEVPAVCEHSNTTIKNTKDANCTEDGYTGDTYCNDCGETISTGSVVEAKGHNYDNGTCTVCGDQKDVGAAEVKELAAFTFPVSGKSGHQDGSDYDGAKFESGKYSLVFTNYSKVYYKANDALGKGCIKFGTSSTEGKLTFTVPSNVTKVVIYLAKYKSNTSKVSINGTTYTLTKNSNDGAYDAIEIDTSVTKTITITTVSGGYRMMMNTIEFWGTEQ